MADHTSISWTDATWNPISGCSRVSEGCRNCYAEAMAARFNKPGMWGEGLATMVRTPDGKAAPRWTGEVRFNDGALDQPLRWRKRRRIFVNSTSDLFHEAVPDEWIDKVFAVMALSPQHTFQVLTKRPERMREYMTPLSRELSVMDAAHPYYAESFLRDRGKSRKLIYGHISVDQESIWRIAWPLPNVWLGVSVEDQVTADVRIPYLLATPAAVRFISAEPLLGPISLRDLRQYNPRGEPWINALRGLVTRGQYLARSPSECSFAVSTVCSPPELPRLDWVIVGGESGPRARPMHPDWVRKIRDQCNDAAVPFHFKQWGCHLPAGQTATQTGLWKPSCGSTLFTTVKNAGRQLDGVEHLAFPEGRA